MREGTFFLHLSQWGFDKKRQSCISFLYLLHHPADGDQFAKLWVNMSIRGHIHRIPYCLFSFFLTPSRCFHLTIGFYSALHPHQRSSCSSPQPTGMFDIPSFKPHQERGHLKTWACVIIFGVPRHPHSEGRGGRGCEGFEFIMSHYFYFFLLLFYLSAGFLMPLCTQLVLGPCSVAKMHLE